MRQLRESCHGCATRAWSRSSGRSGAGWWPAHGGLAAWVGMFDVDLEIVGPAELRAAAALLARRYATAASPSLSSPR